MKTLILKRNSGARDKNERRKITLLKIIFPYIPWRLEVQEQFNVALFALTTENIPRGSSDGC